LKEKHENIKQFCQKTTKVERS